MFCAAGAIEGITQAYAQSVTRGGFFSCSGCKRNHILLFGSQRRSITIDTAHIVHGASGRALVLNGVCVEGWRYIEASSDAWCDKRDTTACSTLGVAWIHTKPPVGQCLRRRSVCGWMDGWVGVLGTAEWILGESGASSGELEE